MDKLARLVTQIANSPPSQWLSTLSPLHLSLIPLLSLASSLYLPALHFRRRLYALGLLRQHRLPVPVISVGNLTWGGNGKTPMVEFIARCFVDSGIPPLILTRVLNLPFRILYTRLLVLCSTTCLQGYGGEDEVKMLERHLQGTPAKIGVGANRAAIASIYFQRYGYIDPRGSLNHETLSSENISCGDKIGVAILDDGMQINFFICPLHIDKHDVY
ncbi:unnamed protein product [Cuscuta epithymum]|uniref:tetraacyldisaccharide 4'-kinase n=1 Tax=Cuscuta epithymum TaxID=186058 RepID=A0AAV0BZH9_9ASTE|nr:unnamed protein product [Cuscuta epithymum]